MQPSDVPRLRLHHQRLSADQLTRPAAVVKWLGAVQAQEFAGAKWAIGQRMQTATDDSIEKAFADGTILRTHLLRPTWHFVAREDIRWMLELTAPRVRSAIGFNSRRMEIDRAIVTRSEKVLTRTLGGGRQLTRDVLRLALQRAGIATEYIRFILILIHAELDGVICSGGRVGKQFTYALMDERAPNGHTLSREEALAELTRRYFISRGPATIRDFVWWSGLTTADAKAGIESAGRRLVREVIDGQSCWLSSAAGDPANAARAYLLPPYDEYLVAYKDRSAAIDAAYSAKETNAIFGPTIVWNGRVIGTWKATSIKNSIAVTLKTFAPLRGTTKRAVLEATRRYGAFVGKAVTVT